MPEERETYKDREIIVTEDDNGPRLSIDGKDVEVLRDETSGQYGSSYLPYTDYPSVTELAKHLIDDSPNFRV